MEVNGTHDAFASEDAKESMGEADEAQETQAAQPALRKRSRKRNITIFVVVSLLNVGLLVLLWTQLITPSQQANTDSNSVYGDYHSPLIGKQAPDFSLPTITSANGTSTPLHLADFKGKPVVLNFWASWCQPCNDEAPYLQKTAFPELKGQGVTFIGVDAPETPSISQGYIQKYGVSYTNVEDTLNGSTAISYGVSTFPMTIFINSKGIVVGECNTTMTPQGLQLELSKLK